MAKLKVNSNMTKWKLEVAPPKSTKFFDFTKIIGPYVSSIKIRHGISEGNAPKQRTRSTSQNIAERTKNKEETAPSELDMRITQDKYIENIFVRGSKIKITFWNSMDKPVLCFDGEMRAHPFGNAQDMINFNVKAYGKEILFSDQQRKRQFLMPATCRSIFTEIASLQGYTLNFLAKDMILKPVQVPFQDCTDMQMLDKLVKDWGMVYYFDDTAIVPTLVVADIENACKNGAISSAKTRIPGSPAEYTIGYRTNIGKPYMHYSESIEWAQGPSVGGSMTEPSATMYKEDGMQDKKYKILVDGVTYTLKGQFQKLAKTDPLMFLQFSAYAAELTMSGSGYEAVRYFYETDGDGPPNKIDAIVPNNSDSSSIALTIILNEGDPDLRAPRTGIIYAGGDSTNKLNTNLPSWLYSTSTKVYGPNAIAINIKETNLTYEQGMLKTEIKATLRTPS
jgi:hypothetical protein